MKTIVYLDVTEYLWSSVHQPTLLASPIESVTLSTHHSVNQPISALKPEHQQAALCRALRESGTEMMPDLLFGADDTPCQSLNPFQQRMLSGQSVGLLLFEHRTPHGCFAGIPLQAMFGLLHAETFTAWSRF